MYVLHVIRSAVRYAAKGKTEVEEESGAGLNISVQLTVVDFGQLVRYLQCQCTMSRARLCPEGHLLNLYTVVLPLIQYSVALHAALRGSRERGG